MKLELNLRAPIVIGADSQIKALYGHKKALEAAQEMLELALQATEDKIEIIRNTQIEEDERRAKESSQHREPTKLHPVEGGFYPAA